MARRCISDVRSSGMRLLSMHLLSQFGKISDESEHLHAYTVGGEDGDVVLMYVKWEGSTNYGIDVGCPLTMTPHRHKRTAGSDSSEVQDGKSPAPASQFAVANQQRTKAAYCTPVCQ
eukprot:scaffold4390_cov71-Skeletonema_dohrnii-CCMP3373.AAC.2